MGQQSDQPSSATTTELTSKRLKSHQLIAILLLVVGGVWTWTSIDAGSESAIGPLLLLLGIVWWFVTRIRIWWHHK